MRRVPTAAIIIFVCVFIACVKFFLFDALIASTVPQSSRTQRQQFAKQSSVNSDHNIETSLQLDEPGIGVSEKRHNKSQAVASVWGSDIAPRKVIVRRVGDSQSRITTDESLRLTKEQLLRLLELTKESISIESEADALLNRASAVGSRVQPFGPTHEEHLQSIKRAIENALKEVNR